MTTPTPRSGAPWQLRDADRTLRLFLTAFLVVVTAGYGIGLGFVNHATSGTSSGLSSEFRGDDEGTIAPEMKFEKSPREMYTFLHNHVFSLGILFFSVGGIFYFSSLVSGGLKLFLLVEPFAAIATTFGGIWLMRFVSPGFSWLVIVSGLSMAVCYLAILFLIMKELWCGQ
ncbi:MAG TPA: hypothetical protein VJO14_03275 [Bacteroidota bacterium]|nr:hypothetical protein [Bacteroidota bacterium]